VLIVLISTLLVFTNRLLKIYALVVHRLNRLLCYGLTLLTRIWRLR